MQATKAQEQKRPKWKEDADVLVCDEAGCETKFGVVKRRHHCRGCGFVYCSEHCKTAIAIPVYGYHTPVKVCHSCATHGVYDPDEVLEAEKEKKEKKKDKKEKKDKKDKKKRAEQQPPAAAAAPPQPQPTVVPPPAPAAPAYGYPAPAAPAAPVPPPVPVTVKAPPTAGGQSQADLMALQKRIRELEGALESEKQKASVPRCALPPVAFRDKDGDSIVVRPHSRGFLVYSVNDEDRAPFRVARWHPEGPAFEFPDIDSALVLPTDCYTTVDHVAEMAEAEGLDHDVSTDAFCGDCQKLVHAMPFCPITGRRHAAENDPPEPDEPPPAGAGPGVEPAAVHLLPLPTQLVRKGYEVKPPPLHAPVGEDDGWSSGDGSEWEDDPRKGRGAACPAPPPPPTLLALPPPPQQLRVVPRVPSALPLAPEPAGLPTQPLALAAPPSPADPAPPVTLSPASAGLPPSKINLMAMAAAQRPVLRKAAPKEEAEPKSEDTQSFGKHLLKKSKENASQGSSGEPAAVDKPVHGQHMLRRSAEREISSKPTSAATTPFGTPAPQPTQPPELSAELVAAKLMGPSAASVALEAKDKPADAPAAAAAHADPEAAGGGKPDPESSPEEKKPGSPEPARPAGAGKEDSVAKQPSAPPAKALPKPVKKHESDSSSDDQPRKLKAVPKRGKPQPKRRKADSSDDDW
ncbi:Vacuolar protein sorting-associated protein 27 [Diplonema papillatum]|nr:Vacuolar protein sorting-associated protein 27 [Diplonema papillatum]